MARVQIINRTNGGTSPTVLGEWMLELQWCRYFYDDGSVEHGYRKIWIRPDGSLQAARGQARIPSRKHDEQLWAQARSEGWGDYDADVIDASGAIPYQPAPVAV